MLRIDCGVEQTEFRHKTDVDSIQVRTGSIDCKYGQIARVNNIILCTYCTYLRIGSQE